MKSKKESDEQYYRSLNTLCKARNVEREDLYLLKKPSIERILKYFAEKNKWRYGELRKRIGEGSKDEKALTRGLNELVERAVLKKSKAGLYILNERWEYHTIRALELARLKLYHPDRILPFHDRSQTFYGLNTTFYGFNADELTEQEKRDLWDIAKSEMRNLVKTDIISIKSAQRKFNKLWQPFLKSKNWEKISNRKLGKKITAAYRETYIRAWQDRFLKRELTPREYLDREMEKLKKKLSQRERKQLPQIINELAKSGLTKTFLNLIKKEIKKFDAEYPNTVSIVSSLTSSPKTDVFGTWLDLSRMCISPLVKQSEKKTQQGFRAYYQGIREAGYSKPKIC